MHVHALVRVQVQVQVLSRVVLMDAEVARVSVCCSLFFSGPLLAS